MVDDVLPLPTAEPTLDRAASAAVALAALVPSIVAVALLVDRSVDLRAADVVRAGLAVAFGVAGVSLVRRSATRRLGLLTLLAVAVAGAGFVGAAWRRGVSDTELARGVASMAMALVPPIALHLLAVLPDGRFGSGRSRAVVVAGYILCAGVGGVQWSRQPDPSQVPLVLVASAGAALVLATVHHRYLAARGAARHRMQWVGLAGSLWIETALVVVALHVLVDWPRHLTETIAGALVLLAVALTAASIPTIAGRVDRLLTHAVSAAGLTAVVTVIYFAVVVGLGRVPTDSDRDILILSMVAAAVSALLYPWARALLRDLAARLVYGGLVSPTDALATFGDRLTRSVPMDELLLQLVEQCTASLDLRSAEVWAGVDGRLTRAASVPDRGTARLDLGEKELPVVSRGRVSGRGWAEIWMPALVAPLGDGPIRVVPLVHAGELFGMLVLERQRLADDFSETDDQVLADLARQIALALHNSELDSALQATLDEVRLANVELEASRARIVATADRERRRIERNLHDGAQQHLVALAVKLKLIQRIAADDPDRALAMVDEVRGDALATVEELRVLAHGIFPPLLVDKGLREALGAAAIRSPLRVEVDADGVGRYRQQDEAAVYFCCLEALQNAAKHAGEDATVRIRLDDTAGDLHFSVTDDGPGFDIGAVGGGHGFVNMTDRVGAIGGSVEVWSQPGVGTRISGCVPARPPEPSPGPGGG